MEKAKRILKYKSCGINFCFFIISVFAQTNKDSVEMNILPLQFLCMKWLLQGKAFRTLFLSSLHDCCFKILSRFCSVPRALHTVQLLHCSNVGKQRPFALWDLCINCMLIHTQEWKSGVLCVYGSGGGFSPKRQ